MKKPSIRPRGYTSITASLAVFDVAAMVQFMQNAFDAEVQFQNDDDAPDFVTVKLGNAMVFVTCGWAAHGHMPAAPNSVTPVSLHHYVGDVAATVDQAVAAGATVVADPMDTFWGERTAVLADPFGHRWTVAERVETLSKGEIAARTAAAVAAATVAELVDEVAQS